MYICSHRIPLNSGGMAWFCPVEDGKQTPVLKHCAGKVRSRACLEDWLLSLKSKSAFIPWWSPVWWVDPEQPPSEATVTPPPQRAVPALLSSSQTTAVFLTPLQLLKQTTALRTTTRKLTNPTHWVSWSKRKWLNCLSWLQWLWSIQAVYLETDIKKGLAEFLCPLWRRCRLKCREKWVRTERS